MNNYKYGKRSLELLLPVEPDLAEVCYLALTLSPYDFGIICGARTKEEQAERLTEGVTQTLRSKHFIQADGHAHAIDFGVYVDGQYINGDTAAEIGYYRKVVQAFFTAALIISANKGRPVAIETGALWRTFVDAGHIQINKGQGSILC